MGDIAPHTTGTGAASSEAVAAGPAAVAGSSVAGPAGEGSSPAAGSSPLSRGPTRGVLGQPRGIIAKPDDEDEEEWEAAVAEVLREEQEAARARELAEATEAEGGGADAGEFLRRAREAVPERIPCVLCGSERGEDEIDMSAFMCKDKNACRLRRKAGRSPAQGEPAPASPEAPGVTRVTPFRSKPKSPKKQLEPVATQGATPPRSPPSVPPSPSSKPPRKLKLDVDGLEAGSTLA